MHSHATPMEGLDIPMSLTQPMEPVCGENLGTPGVSAFADEMETLPADFEAEMGLGSAMSSAFGGEVVAAGVGSANPEHAAPEHIEVCTLGSQDAVIIGDVLAGVDVMLPEAAAAFVADAHSPAKQKDIRTFFGSGGRTSAPSQSMQYNVQPMIDTSGSTSCISTSVPTKRRHSGGKTSKVSKAPKGNGSAEAQAGPGGALAAFGLARSRWQDVCMKQLDASQANMSQFEVKIARQALTMTSLEDALPLLEAVAPLMPSGKAIFAQLPHEWLDFSSRKDALSGKCLFSSRRHEHSIFEPISPEGLIIVPESVREWQTTMDMPNNAIDHATLADEEAWSFEAHPGNGHVRVIVRPGVLLLRMLRRGTALPAARFTWRIFDGQDRVISVEEAAPVAGARVHMVAATMGEFSILSNVEDAAYTQPPRFAQFPLRREQLRSLGWMVAQERRRHEAFVTELRESISFPDAPHWKLEGRLHCEYSDVKGGVLADAIGYGKTACTIGLIDCTATDPFPRVPAPFKGLLPSRATLVLAPTNLHAQWLAEIEKFTGASLKVISVPTCAALKRVSPQEIMEADVVVATYRLFYSNAYMHRLQEVAREVKKDFVFPSMFGGERHSRRQNASPEWAKAYRQVFDLLPRWAKKLRTPSATDPVTPLRPGGRSQHQPASPATTEKSNGPVEVSSQIATPLADQRKRVSSKLELGASAEEMSSSMAPAEDAPTSSQLKRRRVSRKQRVAMPETPVPDASAAWRGLLDGGGWSSHAHYVPLEVFWWRRVVCDEFHELLSRYPPAQIAVELFHAEYKWGLSGTPPCQTLVQIRKAAGFFGVQIPTTLPGTVADNEAEAPRQVAQEWLDAFVRRNTAELPEMEQEEHIVEVQQTAREKALYLALTQGHAAGENDSSSQTQVYMPMQCTPEEVELPPEIRAAQTSTSGLLKLCSHFCASGATDVLTAADECERQLAIRREVVRSSEREMLTTAERACTYVSMIRHFEPHYCANVDSAHYGFVNWESRKILTARLAFLGVHILGTKANLSTRLFEVLASQAGGESSDTAPLSEAAKDFVLRVDFDPTCNITAKSLAAEEPPAWTKMEAMLSGGVEVAPRSGRSVLMRALQEGLGKSASKVISQRCARMRASLGMPRFVPGGDADSEDVAELLGKKRRKNKSEWPRQQEWEWLSDTENAKSLHKVVDAWKRDVQHCSSRLLELASQIDGQQQDLDSFQDTLSTQIEIAEPEDAPSAKTEFSKYGSKIEALVKHVKQLHAEDDGCKVICFVQWEDLKRKISSALEEFGVQHLTLKGSIWARRAALVNFQYEEDSPRLLLLSLQESASGTNLTAANHVIIVHPMEAATREEAVAYEMQAMGRVRRPGQTRKIHIWRFVTVGTVEQQITEEHQRDLWERQRAKIEVAAPADDPSCDSETDLDGEPLTHGPDLEMSAQVDQAPTQVYIAVETPCQESGGLHESGIPETDQSTQVYMSDIALTGA